MDKSDLIKLFSANAHARRFKRGETIVKEGDPPDTGLCFVLAGTVRIVQHHNDQVIPLGLIQTGQFFGETALLLNRTRSATAVADSPEVIIMFLNSERFLAESKNNYHLLRYMSEEAVERIEHVLGTLMRLRQPVAFHVDPTLKTAIQENRSSNLEIVGLLNHTRNIFIGHDKPVFTQGQRNDGLLYLVTQGTIDVLRAYEGKPQQIFEFCPGDFFGYGHPESSPFREYTAVALQDTARVVSFDTELLYRLMRLDPRRFFMLFRSLLTHLIVLDDTLRLAVSQSYQPLASEGTQAIIAQALSEGVTEP